MKTQEQINREKVRLAWCKARREHHAQNLHLLYLPRYYNLCRLLENTFWAPYMSYRTLEEQRKLFESGRTRPGEIVTKANAGDSAHNWGCATDWAEFRPEYVNHEPWDHADWEGFSQCVRDSGLDWGGDWDRDGVTEPGENDFPHAQLPLSKPWRYIGDTYRLYGAEDADREIAVFMRPWEIK